MHARGWVWPLYLGLTVAASPTENRAGSEDAGISGILPQFPIRPPPIPVPPPGFSIRGDASLARRGLGVAKCGPNIGSCAEGYCCSSSGYCGYSRAYCQAPDCLIGYGDGCDALQTPEGENTRYIPRYPLGEVPYAPQPIFHCSVPNTVALTYDDGPNMYTSDLLDILDAHKAKATFFLSGINSSKGPIDDPTNPWMDIIYRMFESEHQIASHTWAHQDLNQLDSYERRNQMVRNEMALRNILGGFPTYMRPPYSSCTYDTGCVDDMEELGYHIAYFDVDTDDYNNDSPDQIQAAKDNFDSALELLGPSGQPLLVIAHDVHEQTVYNLTEHMLKSIRRAGYRAVTLGECLDDDPDHWYRWDTKFSVPRYRQPNNSSRKADPKPKPVSPEPVSLDGSCGPKFTCSGSRFGSCCSGHGFCGNSTAHCGDGCQTTYGVCFDPSS
ncbi:hypothetical protein FQN50_002554 [Emmonsiellopsis sp. PD_5]|nr:hypothetical protein FQN50_002554 [Emmonsiellopsis sp. PD_5]